MKKPTNSVSLTHLPQLFLKIDKKDRRAIRGADFNLNYLKLSKGVLVYLNEKTGEKTEVIVALLDDKGCAKFKQGISGPFGSPQVGTVSTVESLASPIFKLYRKTKRFIQGGKCEVVYNGAV